MATLAYHVFKQQVTHNGGITWEDVVPSVTIKIPITGATCEAPWSARLIGHYSAKPSLEPCGESSRCYGSETVLTDYYSNYPKGINSIGNSLNKSKCIAENSTSIELLLTEGIKTIGNNAFRNVYVNTVSFSGTPQLETIGDYSFYTNYFDENYEYNDDLVYHKNKKRYFNIPDSLKTIGNYAFKNRQVSNDYQWFRPAEYVFSENSSIDTIGSEAFASKAGCVVRFNMPVPPSNISQDILGYTLREDGWVYDDRADGYGVIIVPEQYVSAYKNVLTGLTRSILSETPLGDVGAVQLDGELIPCDSTSSVTVDAQTIERWLKVGNQVKTINGRVPNRLIYLDLGNGLENIGDSVFSGLTNFESISFPNSLKTIGDYAFTMSKFDSITIPSGVTSIGDYAFAGCGRYNYLTDKYSPDVTIKGGTIGTGAFSGGNISSLSLSGVTVIGDYAFCDTGYHFYDLIIPNTVVSIGNYAFRKTSNVWYEDRMCDFTGVTLSDSIKHIGDYAFTTNHNLTVTFSGTPKFETIGVGVFSGITLVNAEHLELPNIKTIGMYAFTDCTDIRDVNFGSGLTSIDYEAFVGCTNLTAVTVNASTPPTLHRGWSNDWAFDDLHNYLIYVPCEAYNTYISSDWGRYSGRIRMKEGCTTPYPDFKLKLYYNNDQPAWVQCDGNTTLTSGNTWPSSFDYASITGAEISNCVTSIGSAAFEYCHNLREVSIPSGLTSIGNSGFSVCNSLTSIEIPDTVTSIGNRAFYYCISLTGATLPNNLSILSRDIFRDCRGLTSIVIPDSVYVIGVNAFAGCKSLTSVTVGNGVEYVEDSAFADCKSLTNVTLPSSVVQIGQNVFGGSPITALTINATTPPALSANSLAGNFTIYVPCESVNTYIRANRWSDYASRIEGIPPCEPPTDYKYKLTFDDYSTEYGYCDGTSAVTSGEISTYRITLIEAKIGDCVTSISNKAFSGCTNLTSLTISNNVTSINGNAFENCSGLTTLTIPDSVTSLGNQTFMNCTNLTNVRIGSGITNLPLNTFAMCTNLTSIGGVGSGASVEIPTNITNIRQQAFWGCVGLTSVNIPDSVTNIEFAAFESCTGFTDVTIGSGITSIGGNNIRNCTGLLSVTIKATTPPTLSGINFENTNNCPIYVPCASVDVYKAASGWSDYASRIEGIPPCGQPTFNGKFKLILNDSSVVTAECNSTSSVTSGEVATQYSGSVTPALVEAEIGDCVKTIGGGAFYNCSGLTSVTISDNVKSISGFAFGSCTNLVTCNMGTGVTKMGSSVFQICRSLTGITIPNGVTSIERWTFYQCYSLTSITIPNSVATIAQAAFNNCTGLTGNLLIPDSVTSISDSAFSWCKGLSAATIGSGITTIGRYAFLGCSSLASITINTATPPALGEDPFSSTNNCPIYVPSGSVNAYKSAEGWSIYSSRIQPIPT